MGKGKSVFNMAEIKRKNQIFSITTKNIIVILICGAIFAHIGYAETTLKLATGSKTGVYYPIGLALKKAIESYTDINIVVYDTNGSNENVTMLQEGEADLALMQNDIAYRFTEIQGKIGGVAALYSEFVQIITLKDMKLENLKGCNIRIRSKEVSGESSRDIVLEAVGLKGNITECFYTIEKALEALLKKDIDAAIFITGIPTDAIIEIENNICFVPIQLKPLVVRKLKQSCPYFMHSCIPADTYGTHEKIKTVALRALLVASLDLDEGVVQKLTEAIFENSKVITKSHQAIKNINRLSACKGMTIPFHPGAKKAIGPIHILWSKITEYKFDILIVLFGFFLIGWVIKSRKITRGPLQRNIYAHYFCIFFCLYAIGVICMYLSERSKSEHFEDLTRSIWSTAVYVLSGFEGHKPETTCGKIASIYIFLLKIIFGGVVAGMFAVLFWRKENKVPSDIKQHIIICNWSDRGDKIITELHAPQAEPETDIVVISTKKVDEKKLRKDNSRYKNVYFVHNNPLLYSALESHKVHFAKSVIVLADENSQEPDSNSTVITLAIRKLSKNESEPHIVVEVINHQMKRHIENAGANETICSTDFGLGVLAQCAIQAKLSCVYNDLLRYSKDTNEIYLIKSNRFPSSFIGKTFAECANVLNNNRESNNPVILLGLKRNDEIFLNPIKGMVSPEIVKDDALVIMAFQLPNLAGL